MAHNNPLSLKHCPLVLIIEDEPGDAQLIRLQLLDRDRNAFTVQIVDSLARAQSLAETLDARPDVLLLDLNLPDSTGVATVERCRAMFSDVPMVVLTGLDDHQAIAAAIEAGAEDYLPKGADGGTLRRAIRYALLRHERDTYARLAATVFAHARECIVITDPQGAIIDINPAFTRVTGFTREEALGQNPRMLQSGHHTPEFYAGLWRDLREQGQWHDEIWNRRKNGELFVAQLTITAVHDSTGKMSHYVGQFSDISLQKEQQRQLEHLAHHDALTSLPNRVLLADRLHQALSRAQRNDDWVAVAYLDLDGFKAINDTYSHGAGDQLLMALSRRMRKILRETDTLARLGGDEFVVVATDLPEPATVMPLIDRLLEVAVQPVQVGDHVLQVSASLGLTFYPQTTAVDADQLLRQADHAMYQAKLSGKNRYSIFEA